jgi:hypothetical protein
MMMMMMILIKKLPTFAEPQHLTILTKPQHWILSFYFNPSQFSPHISLRDYLVLPIHRRSDFPREQPT